MNGYFSRPPRLKDRIATVWKGKTLECGVNPTICAARRAFPGTKRQPAGTATVLSAQPWLLLPHVDRRHPFAAARRRLLL